MRRSAHAVIEKHIISLHETPPWKAWQMPSWKIYSSIKLDKDARVKLMYEMIIPGHLGENVLQRPSKCRYVKSEKFKISGNDAGVNPWMGHSFLIIQADKAKKANHSV